MVKLKDQMIMESGFEIGKIKIKGKLNEKSIFEMKAVSKSWKTFDTVDNSKLSERLMKDETHLHN